MAAYIIATVRITDPVRFAAYGKAVTGLSAKYGGENVLIGKVTDVLEGDSPLDERVVVVRFPDADAARSYIASPEYQTAKLERVGAADIEMRIVV
jgi:uncharacterized protein (DUF1330 family)